MNETRVTIYKTFMFEASHILPKHPGQCSRLHGHSWKLSVGISGPIDKETGFVADYAKLSELVKAHIIMRVDHQHLGQGMPMLAGLEDEHMLHQPTPFGPSFYPSSENLVVAFVRILRPLVQELGEGEKVDFNGNVTPATVQLEEVSLDETCTSKCTWRRSNG